MAERVTATMTLVIVNGEEEQLWHLPGSDYNATVLALRHVNFATPDELFDGATVTVMNAERVVRDGIDYTTFPGEGQRLCLLDASRDEIIDAIKVAGLETVHSTAELLAEATSYK